jgi:hypothetical protein
MILQKFKRIKEQRPLGSGSPVYGYRSQQRILGTARLTTRLLLYSPDCSFIIIIDIANITICLCCLNTTTSPSKTNKDSYSTVVLPKFCVAAVHKFCSGILQNHMRKL